MKQSPPPVVAASTPQRALAHDDIAQCAKDLWVEYGRPDDRDVVIWLEAETRLRSATNIARETARGTASLPSERSRVTPRSTESSGLIPLNTRLEPQNDDEHR